MQQQGPAGLLPLWTQLRLATQAQAYADLFLIAGGCALLGAMLALLLRRPGLHLETGQRPAAEHQ
jgi:hypothetical protein